MKKFLVDFEGEEEYPAPAPARHTVDSPDYFIFWDTLKSAEDTCEQLYASGHICWVAKFIGPDQNTYFGSAVSKDLITGKSARAGSKTINIDLKIERGRFGFVAFHISDIKIIDIREYEPNDAYKKDIMRAQWVQRAKEDLEEYTGGYIVNIHELWGEEWAGGGVDMRSAIGGKQWIVFDGVSDARAVAVAKIRKEIEEDPIAWGEEVIAPHLKSEYFHDVVESDAEGACEEFNDIQPWLPDEYDNANAIEQSRMRVRAATDCVGSYVSDAMNAGVEQYFSDRFGPEWLHAAIDILGLNYDHAADAAVETLEDDEPTTGLVMADVKFFLDLRGDIIYLAHGGVAIEVS